jgi:hypothetical protein
MPKRFALVFAIAGFLAVICLWILNLWPSAGYFVLRISCPVCPFVDATGNPWLGYLLFSAPFNVLLYAAVGYVCGLLLTTLKKS